MAGAPPRRLREFSELPSVRAAASRADAALGASAHADAWADITSAVDGLVPVSRPPASRPPLDPGLSPRGAPDVDDDDDDDDDGDVPSSRGERALPARPGPAADFLAADDASLKTHALVVSAHSLAWAAALPQSLCYAAVQSLWRGGAELPAWAASGGGGGGDGGGDGGGTFLFARALLHFRHPSTPLMASVASQWQLLFTSRGGGPAGAPAAAAVQRLEAWQGAFRSLFYGFRYGQVRRFYVVLSTTAMLFEYPESGDPCVVIPQATPGLLGLLEEYGVPFIARHPRRRRLHADADNSRDGDGEGGGEELAPGGDEDGGGRGVGDGEGDGDGEGGPLPVLLVHGAVNAHAAFNFVLAVGPRLANATDVPLLVSDAPFAGGQVTAAGVRDARATRTAGGSLRYDVHVDGLLTPLQMSRLCEALHRRQGGEFAAFVDTEVRSVGVNGRGAAGEGAGDGRVGALGSSVVSRVVSTGKIARPVTYVRDGLR